MSVALRAACLLAVVGLLAASLSAQTYTRTQTTEPYAQRNSAPMAATRIGNLDDGAWEIALPFSFPFFDRTYRQCFINSNGSVSFAAMGVTGSGVSTLATPVAAGRRESIHALRTDLAGNELLNNFTAHAESGRVVIQWRQVASAANAGAYHLNFQCHLLATGDIEIHYGPESVNFDQDLTYVSGIADSSGGASFAGFNNLLTVQTLRPAASQLVTFVPTGFTQLNGVEISVRQSGLPAQTDFKGQGTGKVVGSFTLSRRGTGGTVSGLTVHHFAAGALETFDLLVYRDATNPGFLDASDVPLGGGAQSMAGSTSTTFTLSEPIAAVERNYLLVVNATSFGTYYQRDVNALAFSFDASDLAVDTLAWGGYFTAVHEFAPGHVVRAGVSRFDAAPAVTKPGLWDAPLLSFELRNQPQYGNAIVTQFSFALTLAGIAIGDITDVALFRDLGQRGVADTQDTLIDFVTDPASTTISFSSSEWIANTGSDYLLAFTLDPASVAEGTVSAALLGLNFSTGVGVVTPVGVSGSNVLCTQTGTTLLVRTRPDARLDALPVSASQLNVPANAFNLITSFSSTTVTSLIFRGDTTGIFAARLYQDAGTLIGRLDGSDAQVGGTPVIVSAASGTITFTFATVLPVSAGGSDLLLVVDFSAAAAGVSHVLSLSPADVACIVPVAGVTATGCSLNVQAGAANGVNVTGVSLSPSVVLEADDMKVLGTVQLAARGVGGSAPQLLLAFEDGVGGVGDGSGFTLYMYIEGAGPLGVLDSTDLLLNTNDVSPFTATTAITLLANGTPNSVTGARNILLCVRRHAWQFSGTAAVRWRGFTGGTDVQLPALPDALAARLTASYTDPAQPPPANNNPPQLESACSTGEGASWWLVLLALPVLMRGLTRRRA
ncbi:MAG: hypothetical protein KBG84_01800 [Planctomycetes bacterium]|nr:hypothetical protein [Planctomycetota bacterium]